MAGEPPDFSSAEVLSNRFALGSPTIFFGLLRFAILVNKLYFSKTKDGQPHPGIADELKER
jgi:hypothetical protein